MAQKDEGRRGSRVARRRDGVLWRHTITGALVLPPQRDEPLVLDDVGAMVWELLQDAPTVDGLTSTLAARFEVDREQVSQDVDEFLNGLRREGAIELRTPP